MFQAVAQEALIRLLVEKGIFTEEEFLEMANGQREPEDILAQDRKSRIDFRPVRRRNPSC